METLASEKQALRRTLKERFVALPADARHAQERLACGRFTVSAYFNCARAIMLYAPTPGEFDISPAILAALGAGRTVCLPRVNWDRATMTPHLISAFPGGLVEGRHGILEPGPDTDAIDPSDLDLVVTPGVGFDSWGGRLGRGAGFYDRFLAGPSFVGLCVGVALEAQIVERLPMREPGTCDVPDRRMDAVITERRIILGIDRPRVASAD